MRMPVTLNVVPVWVIVPVLGVVPSPQSMVAV